MSPHVFAPGDRLYLADGLDGDGNPVVVDVTWEGHQTPAWCRVTHNGTPIHVRPDRLWKTPEGAAAFALLVDAVRALKDKNLRLFALHQYDSQAKVWCSQYLK